MNSLAFDKGETILKIFEFLHFQVGILGQWANFFPAQMRKELVEHHPALECCFDILNSNWGFSCPVFDE